MEEAAEGIPVETVEEEEVPAPEERGEEGEDNKAKGASGACPGGSGRIWARPSRTLLPTNPPHELNVRSAVTLEGLPKGQSGHSGAATSRASTDLRPPRPLALASRLVVMCGVSPSQRRAALPPSPSLLMSSSPPSRSDSGAPASSSGRSPRATFGGLATSLQGLGLRAAPAPEPPPAAAPASSLDGHDEAASGEFDFTYVSGGGGGGASPARQRREFLGRGAWRRF